MKWESYENTVIPTISGGSTEDQIQAAKLIDLTDSLFLEQLVVKPTRENNVLDLIFTNDENFISDICISKTGISDPNLINASLSPEYKLSQSTANVIQEESCSKLERYSFWSKIMLETSVIATSVSVSSWTARRS